MKIKNVVPTVSVLIALVCASQLFIHWNPEMLLRRDELPITMNDISKSPTEDFTGSLAGNDIGRLDGAEDFSKMSFDTDYMTAEPVGIIPTGVYSLKPWVDRYNTDIYKGRTKTGSRRAEVSTSGFDILGNYNQYYLLELPDHTYIPAQIPQSAVHAIEKGKKITLPIGQRVAIPDAAEKHLSASYKEYNIDVDGTFYAFDNEWQAEHHFTLFIMRFAASALLFFAIAVGLTFIGNEVIQKKDSDR